MSTFMFFHIFLLTILTGFSFHQIDKNQHKITVKIINHFAQKKAFKQIK